MKNFKVLPVTLAVVAALSASAVYAEDDAAVDPAFEVKATEEDKEQPLVISPETEIPEGIVFSGYARYGAHYSGDEKKYVGAEGQLAGNAAGRLGNEGNGGEFQFAKGFKGENGTIWDVVLMMENWYKAPGEYGDVAMKKFYAGATNVFASQPDAYFWAGRDFHQRPQQGLNDYFWMTHDGQGAGVYNLDYGVKIDFAFVGQADGPGDNGNYAFTSKFHGMNLGDSAQLSILANYGFSDGRAEEAAGTEKREDAYQVAAVLNTQWARGGNNFILRYSDKSDTSVYNTKDGANDIKNTVYASVEGNVLFSDQFELGYLLGWHDLTNETATIDDRTNTSAIIRPTYAWNDIHSTWLEAGYSDVNYKNQGSNSAWKVTLSQNISMNMGPGARPMLRFYATAGEADNQVNGSGKVDDTLALGAMFESWW